MNKLNQFFFVLVFSVILVAYSDAHSQVSTVNLDTFVSKIKATPSAQLLDVRTPGEWAQGKIPSSTTINIQDPAFVEKASKLDKNKPVFVYCAVGGRSASAAKILEKAGFKQVVNLSGAGYSGLAAKGVK